MIDRVVHTSHSYSEAEEWDLLQHIRMTPEERRRVARELRRRVYGERCPDVRDAVQR